VNDQAPALEFEIQHLLEVGRPRDARPLLGRLLRLEPDRVESLYLAAQIEYDDAKPDEARRRVHEALARAPAHRGARILRFRLELDAERFGEAEAAILGLLRDSPEDAFCLTLYARLMVRVQQLDKARALIDEALRLAPELPAAQVHDTLLHVIRGDRDAASGRLAQLVREDPDAVHVAWTAIYFLQSQGRWGEVLTIARELMRVIPGDSDLVDVIVEARLWSHWSTRPLWPFVRFGWGGSIGVWLAGGLGLSLLGKVVSKPLLLAATGSYLLYIVYSWVWPPLLRRRLRTKGF
jgi:predicted Zn-dependent protease